MADLLSDALEWSELSNKLYNQANKLIDEFYEALNEANNLVNEVANQGDIGSLHMTVTMNEIETLNEKRRKLISFANGIHYEINDLVDNPFCLKLSDVTDGAYDLNPSDIRVTTGKILFIKQVTSLSDLILSTISDDDLKKDLEDKLEALDRDKPSSTLSEVMKEAIFWEKEFKKAEQAQEIAENIFTQDVRDRWIMMTADERTQIIEEYVDKLGQNYYKERRNWWQKLTGQYPSNVSEVNINYTTTGYGARYGTNSVGINNKFVSDPIKNYSVDKVIDTLSHEVRHQYQHDVLNHPDTYGTPESVKLKWDFANYISSSDSRGYNAYYNQTQERDARAFAAISRPENDP